MCSLHIGQVSEFASKADTTHLFTLCTQHEQSHRF